MRKSSYREPGEEKYERDLVYSRPPTPEKEHEDVEPERSFWLKLIKAGLILLAATFLYFVLIRKPPYCEETAQSQCNYKDAGFQIY